MYYVKFPDLNHELIDFLKKRIRKKECPIHFKKARIKIDGNEAIVTDICCEHFSELIGQSPQIHILNKTAVKIRGLVINDYTNVEIYLETIIQLANDKYSGKFQKVITPEEIEFFSMREKQGLLKTALDIYSDETGLNIEKIWGQFGNVMKIRNCLAHWPIDTSVDAQKLIRNEGKVRFVKVKNGSPIKNEDFDLSRANKVVNASSKLVLDLIPIYYYFRDKAK